MAASEDRGLARWLIPSLISVLVMLGVWNTREVHLMRVDLATLQQMVLDGKEARLLYQNMNQESHVRYDLDIKRLDVAIMELKVRIVTLERQEATRK